MLGCHQPETISPGTDSERVRGSHTHGCCHGSMRKSPDVISGLFSAFPHSVPVLPGPVKSCVFSEGHDRNLKCWE